MRQGIEKAADFPSPVAVQQRMSCPSRIAEMSSSRTILSLFIYSGIIFLTMVLMVSIPTGSCQWGLAILWCSNVHNAFEVSKSHQGVKGADQYPTNIDAMRSDCDFRVWRLHKHFLTRFLGHDKQQTSYDHELRYDFTSYRSCLGETRIGSPKCRVIAGSLSLLLPWSSILQKSITHFDVLGSKIRKGLYSERKDWRLLNDDW